METKHSRIGDIGDADTEKQQTLEERILELSSTRRDFRTNSNGLPCEIQIEVIKNVLLNGGTDSFSSTCNKQQNIFGTPNSNIRKRIQNRRYRIIKLRRENPKEFATLCRSVGLEELLLNQQQDKMYPYKAIAAGRV